MLIRYVLVHIPLKVPAMYALALQCVKCDTMLYDAGASTDPTPLTIPAVAAIGNQKVLRDPLAAVRKQQAQVSEPVNNVKLSILHRGEEYEKVCATDQHGQV